MVIYAITTAISIGSVSPFMQVLFERTGEARVGEVPLRGQADPALTRPLAHEPLAEASPLRWPAILKARVERALIDARPLVALERICLFLLFVLLLKNL